MSTQVFTLPLNTAIGANVVPSLLPPQVVGARDKEVWAVVPAAALSWHCITLPSGMHKQKNRLLPALQALMEEHLLDEPEAMHLALQPHWQVSASGSQVWVAACPKNWLRSHLDQLQKLGRSVHRIVPEWSPAPVSSAASSGLTSGLNAGDAAQAWISGTPEDAWLWVSDSQGAWRLPLQAGIQWWSARLNSLHAKAPDIAQTLNGFNIQSEPAVAELAQKSLQTLRTMVSGALAESLQSWRIVVESASERHAQAAASQWDLAQFEFAAHGSARRRQSIQRAWQQFAHDVTWRPVRWSLAVLIAVQWVGLNVSAWQLDAKVKAQRELQKNILTQTFPNVPVVDVSLQMARELERLQHQAGTLNAKDLEGVLQAIGLSLPDGQSISALDFQVQGEGEIRLQGLQLQNEQEKQFVNSLRAQGYEALLNAGQWRIVSKPRVGAGA
jgi:general secretion pathway protein L